MDNVIGIRPDTENVHAVLADLNRHASEVASLACVCQMADGSHKVWVYGATNAEQMALCEVGKMDALAEIMGVED